MRVRFGAVVVVCFGLVGGAACKGDDSAGPTDDGGGDVDNDFGGDADVAEEDGADAVEDDGATEAEAEADAVDPCWDYPCEPYGTDLGDVVPDWHLEPVNTAGGELAGADMLLDLHDYYQLNEEHGGTAKALFVYVSAVWCTYCEAESDLLEALYQELHPLGVEFLGLISDGPVPGTLATTSQARQYAGRHRWTFPTAVVSPELNAELNHYWPPADRASGSLGVPLNMFFDLRDMRMYGHFAGAVASKLLRYPLTELATDPQWSSPGVRRVTLDCAPGTGTETEPNTIGETPEPGTTMPYALSGVLCPPVVGDGLFIDEDDVDLGTLDPGTVLDVEVTPSDGSDVYPFALLAHWTGSTIDWTHDAPYVMGTGPNGRQFVIDRRARYYLAVFDGRARSTSYYGLDPVPAADECCDGGPAYTYDLAVDRFTLAPTDDVVTVGTSAAFTLDGGDLNVHPFDVVAGTVYQVRLEAADAAVLDPYLVVWDPAASTVLGYNDDEDTAGRNYNSLLSVPATGTATVWVIAGYKAANFRSGAPSYTIRIE
jgi:thiol-disulfide isomerase/thioredoxin